MKWSRRKARCGWISELVLLGSVPILLNSQGVAYLNNWSGVPFKSLVIATLCLASGTCIVAGFLTPLACTFSVLCSIGLAVSWLPLPANDVLSDNLVIITMIVMAIVIAVLGPGAFSLDSRMFGRREIVIPPSVRGTSTQNPEQKFS